MKLKFHFIPCLVSSLQKRKKEKKILSSSFSSFNKQHSLWRKFIFLHCRFASNKYFSISFPFSRFRCSCSRKSHSKNVELFEKLEKTAFLSLAERRRRKSSSVVVEIVVCLIATNFNHSANPIAREFHPV